MKLGKSILLRAEQKGKLREFITAVSVEKFHTDFGIIDLEELLQKEIGDTIISHMGQEFIIQKPRMPDHFKYAKRTGAPMIPKDIGSLIAYTGLNKEDSVLDAGTGSGILAMYLGSIAKHVLSYEVRDEFVDVARKNMERAGLDNVEVRCGNIVDEIANLDEKFDVVTLDTIDSKDVISNVRKVLLPGGFVVTYSPFIEQTKEIRDRMAEVGFVDVLTLENIEREITFSDRGTRPATTRVGHTGYITIARM
ncbi:MAG: methyltransferase domain-containing protein [Methanosarcinaceae archaeon]|nr:methyltransferase domain-containing protein [Methanosarcinaceae archaeon]